MNVDYLINLIIVINIILNASANIPVVGQTFKKKLQPVLTKAESYLQSLPKTISTIIFLMIILGLFGIGKIQIEDQSIQLLRIISVLLFVIFSWVQIYSIKLLGEFYSPDIIIYKQHRLIDKGIYKVIRHPIYVSQIFQDFFAGIALMNLPIIFMTIFLEVPLYIARTNLEEKFLERNLTGYIDYKKRTGKWLPKIMK